jgi:cytochrome c peroxidase
MRRMRSRNRSNQEVIPRRGLGSAPGLPELTQTARVRLLSAGWFALWVLLTLVVAVVPATAQVSTACPAGAPAGAICNGARNGLFTELFFEPETPPGSLKTTPIWNELEQLLDNPYAVTTVCNDAAGPVPGTREAEFGITVLPNWPSYCSTIVRRPSFSGVVLPPLLVHPLNYNPTTGVEMRLINSQYPGGGFNNTAVCTCMPAANQFQGSPYTTCQSLPKSFNGIGADNLGCRPNQDAKSMIHVSSGASRLPPGSDSDIDYNNTFQQERSPTPAGLTCQINTEPVPFAPDLNGAENLIVCGGDAGEPGGTPFGVLDTSAYSTPAVPGVGLAANGDPLPIPASARLYDAARGGFIQPRDAAGVGGLRKPSLRVPDTGGTNAIPNFLWNSAAAVAGRPGGIASVAPSNENDYLQGGATGSPAKEAARRLAMVLGKSLFWDQQAGSDAVQSCGSCHASAGADNRTKNQLNPNHLGGDLSFQIHPPNGELVATDFPFHKLANPDIAGDPFCSTPIVANVAGVAFPDGDPPVHPLANPAGFTVCSAANITSDANDVASSMGVHFGTFRDIPPIGTLTPAAVAVKSVVPDLRSLTPSNNVDPIPGFAGAGGPTGSNQFRRVEPRNTPTFFAVAFNFDNFWDGRARHDFNGGSVFGASDPQFHVIVDNAGTLTPTRQIIRFVSVASLATGPALSEFEMSFLGRNWAKIGKKLLQPGVTPLANQLVDPTDGILGPYSNQNGSACGSVPVADRTPGSPAMGKPGLCITYPGLIKAAYDPQLWRNTTSHLNGCYTDGNTTDHPNQCAGGTVAIPVLSGGAVVNSPDDPFDHFVLSPAAGAANPTDTNQFTQMEGNFSLFWGLSIHLWATILVPDNTPFDQFMEKNPDGHHSVGETGEPLLVLDLPNCPGGGPGRECFLEVGNFKRDAYNTAANPGSTTGISPYSNVGEPLMACTNFHLVAGVRVCDKLVAASGTRNPNSNAPDPLLGFDIFFGSNLSLKNFEFRSARCGACHNAPTLTDNTFPFTIKAQLPDQLAEFFPPLIQTQVVNGLGVEPSLEPMGRMRVISGFLLEEEANSNGQDAIERRMINESIAPAPVFAASAAATAGGCPVPTASCSGYAFPDAITNFNGTGYTINHDVAPDATFTGYGGAFFDNGVYNIGVRPCLANQSQVIPEMAGALSSIPGEKSNCEDNGRGNTDPFGWPLSLAALLMKNLGGPAQEPGLPIPGFNPGSCTPVPFGAQTPLVNPTTPYGVAPTCSGGLWEVTAQDQQINPGISDEQTNSLLPPYLAPWANRITVGDSHPDLDEGGGPTGGMINTLTDAANSEGFPAVPFDSLGTLTENLSPAMEPYQGTWPFVNRVGRFGSFKAPQIREVELTGPYFHNGGKLTLRQVVDFYVRGGDFPITNATHRDFNIENLSAELQSNLSEEEKVGLVDFMLELTDDRVRFERAPFDHPEVFLPLDGTAPENTFGREGFLTGLTGICAVDATGKPSTTGTPIPGATGPCFKQVPAVGAAGSATPVPNFLGIAGRDPATGLPIKRLSGASANCAVADSQYCR